MTSIAANLRTVLLRLVAGLLVLCAAFSSGCRQRETEVARGNRTQVLHRGLSADPSGLDPHLITGLPEINIVTALFEGLVGEDATDGHPVPAVAERWDVSADGLIWTFHLRANARWSNGEPVTAADFVAGFRRALSPQLGADNAGLLFVLANGEAWHRGDLKDFGTVGAHEVDARTLRLTLAHPAPYLPALLAHPITYPVYLPALEKAGGATERSTNWTTPERIVSNGPFILKSAQRGQVYIVEKSATYWDAGRVRLAAIHFHPAEDREGEERAFRAGQLHITEALPVGKVDSYRRDNPAALKISPFLDTYFYRLNTTRPGLGDKRVRQALSLALDREAIVTKITRGGQQAAASFVSPELPGYTPPQLPPSNLDRARALLAVAGYPEGRGLPPLEVTINSSGNHRIIAEAVQQMWARLGVKVEINNLEMATLFAKRRALDYSILRSEWAADFADPKSYLDVFRGDSSNNHTGWANLRYDALLREADHEADPAQRSRLLQQAETILLDELPLIPVFHFTTVRLVNPAVRGWNPLPLDRHPYKHVWLEP